MNRFAVLPYTNAAPLAHFIPQACPNAELIYRTPRQTLDELLQGRVDAAIVPVVDFFSTPDLEMVNGLGICCNGDVESVLLQCKRPQQQVREINLDPASRTSNLLAKVLFRDYFRVYRDVEFGVHLENPDASVLIGDRALCAERAFESYDLGGRWKAMAGLPFVFAVWAYKAGHPDSGELSRTLHTAKRMGSEALGELSALHAERLGLAEPRCCHYLTSCIHYDVGRDETAGMELFRELSKDLIETPQRAAEPARTQILGVTPNDHKLSEIERV